jgi:hypothetical protein
MESIMYLQNVSLPYRATYESTSQGWVASIAGKRPVKIDDPRRRWKRGTWKQHTTLPPSVAFHVKEKDNSKVLCLNCKKLGHYARKYPGRNNKVSKQRRTDLVTCQKCNQNEHYTGKCAEKSTSKFQ